MLPLFERLGIRILSCISRRRAVRGAPLRAPRAAERHHLLEEPHEPRAQDEEALGHPVPRGVVLRDDRHREGAARHRARARPRGGRRERHGRRGRGARRGGGGALPRADRAVPRAARGQARGALHRRREDLVDGERPARAGRRDPRGGDPELHARGLPPDEGARCTETPASSRTPRPPGSSASCARSCRTCRGRREDEVPRAEDPDALPRHQPRPGAPVRRVRGDGHVRAAARPHGEQPDLAGALGAARPGSGAAPSSRRSAPPRAARRGAPRGGSLRVARGGAREGRDGEPAEELARARRDARVPRRGPDARRCSTGRRAARRSSGCSSRDTSRSRSRSTRPR